MGTPHETPYNELLKRRRDHDYSGEEALMEMTRRFH